MVIYTNLLKYYESTGDIVKQGKLLGNLGSLYYTAGNQEKAGALRREARPIPFPRSYIFLFRRIRL